MTTVLCCRGVVMADRRIIDRTTQEPSDAPKIKILEEPSFYKGRAVTFISGSGNRHLNNTIAHCVMHGIDPVEFVSTLIATKHIKGSFARTHVIIGVENGLFLIDASPKIIKGEQLDYDGLYVLGSGTPYVRGHLKENTTTNLLDLFSKALGDPSTGSVVDIYDSVRKQRFRVKFKDPVHKS